MKILMTVFDIQNYGGIVNHAEVLRKGLREIGHTCDLILLRNRDKNSKRKATTTSPGGFAGMSQSGEQVHALYGWFGVEVFGYGSPSQITKWKRLVSKYDLVIHQIPVPSVVSLDKEGYWKEIYEVDTPQIIAVHDLNFPNLYPHMLAISHKICGLAAVHPASYQSLAGCPVPRALLPSSHIPRDWEKQKPWVERDTAFVSAHVWKAWKQVDTLLRSIPHMPKSIRKIMAGDGIELRYIRSKETKPKSREFAMKLEKYKGLWDKSLASGLEYHGMLAPNKVAKLYQASRVMVDTSYSSAMLRYGCHVNRSTLEAYNNGCVPFLITQAMAEIRVPKAFFTAGLTHLAIPWKPTSKTLASAIEEAILIPEKAAETIISNGRSLLLKHFHYLEVAAGFIRLAKGKPCGMYGKLETGKEDPALRDECNRILRKLAPKKTLF